MAGQSWAELGQSVMEAMAGNRTLNFVELSYDVPGGISSRGGRRSSRNPAGEGTSSELRGGGALGGPYAPAGGLGSTRGGPWRLGHARAAATAAATGASTATVAVCDGEHERDVKEMAAKLRAVLVGSEETGSGGNGSGQTRARGGNHGGRVPERAQHQRAREGEWGDRTLNFVELSYDVPGGISSRGGRRSSRNPAGEGTSSELRGGGALGGPYAPAGGLGSTRGGPWRLGHARAAATAAATGASTATVAVCDGEHERDVKEMAAKLRAVLVGSEETGSGGNGSGQTRARGGNHGGRVPERAQHQRAREGEWGGE
ncbi:glycine-rich protein DOT1-like [Miscanthus floridulus]|uniref:glycine-rich protein DOT1-like n=1 Tax=Miscanthus floridulus TaxID=154761 RepID=UPI0034585072